MYKAQEVSHIYKAQEVTESYKIYKWTRRLSCILMKQLLLSLTSPVLP